MQPVLGGRRRMPSFTSWPRCFPSPVPSPANWTKRPSSASPPPISRWGLSSLMVSRKYSLVKNMIHTTLTIDIICCGWKHKNILWTATPCPGFYKHGYTLQGWKFYLSFSCTLYKYYIILMLSAFATIWLYSTPVVAKQENPHYAHEIHCFANFNTCEVDTRNSSLKLDPFSLW